MAMPDGQPVLLLLLVEQSPWQPLLPLQISIERFLYVKHRRVTQAKEPTVNDRGC